ncbi:DUF3833 domain-containing protein [Litorivicinus sp.]|nr:DUF3833 domain-containing protein [Litorivicinus sp.]
MRKLVFLSFCLLILSGCATSIQGPNYQSIQPQFDLFNFFEGSVKAWGLVQGRNGELIQRFEVDIQGSVTGDRMVLDERFSYGFGDGVRDRVWTIDRLESGAYRGVANDVLEVATGQSFGNAFHWTYRMNLPVGDQIFEVVFEDWFWALDDKRIFNRSYLQKFGFDVAEVTIFMERQ